AVGTPAALGRRGGAHAATKLDAVATAARPRDAPWAGGRRRCYVVYTGSGDRGFRTDPGRAALAGLRALCCGILPLCRVPRARLVAVRFRSGPGAAGLG